MPVGLKHLEELSPIKGIQLASDAAGLKKSGADDLVLITLNEGAEVAAAFTQNAFCAAPVIVAKDHLAKRTPRALLINAGNANAGTGTRGEYSARQSCQAVARMLNLDETEVLPFSTGVIGEHLPVEKICRKIPDIVNQLDADNWMEAAKGIMTTDTLPKGCSRQLTIDNKIITITGIIKGAGMICPNMATMLAFIGTDACVEGAALQGLLKRVLAYSLNSLTVDGDTSTNDACVVMASGQAANRPLDASHPDWPHFVSAMQSLFIELGQAVIRDAEGATKFVTLRVEGGSTETECRQVAYTVAHSPLVKTALFASDANWGRLLAAIGRSGLEHLDINLIDLYLGEINLIKGGQPVDGYQDSDGQAEMAKNEITVRIVLGRGTYAATVWTSDLSHEYVTINAEYRT